MAVYYGTCHIMPLIISVLHGVKGEGGLDLPFCTLSRLIWQQCVIFYPSEMNYVVFVASVL